MASSPQLQQQQQPQQPQQQQQQPSQSQSQQQQQQQQHELVRGRKAFRGVTYEVGVSLVHNDTLVVEVEEIPVGDRWKGQFSAKYIEEITQKTGNFKKFSVFVKMLLSSLADSNETVHIDLLTHEDLEMMKRTARPSATTPAQPPKNKRYLILTYVVEFDRVHYPLPLTHLDCPSPASLRVSLRRLQDQLADAQRDALASNDLELRCQSLTASLASQSKEIDSLRKQVAQQQMQVQGLQEQLVEASSHHNGSGPGVGELLSLKSRLEKLEDELEEEKATHKRLMLHKNREYRVLTEELDHEKAVNQELKEEIATLKKGRTSDRTHRSPSVGRFDPTAYVRDRKNKTLARSSSLERQRPPSTDRSRNSTTSDRYRSPSSDRRPPSADRFKSPTPRRPPSATRSSSVERRPPSADRTRPSSADRQRNNISRTSNTSTSSNRRTPDRLKSTSSTTNTTRSTNSNSSRPTTANNRAPSSERNRGPSSERDRGRMMPSASTSTVKANGSHVNGSRSSSRERERGREREREKERDRGRDREREREKERDRDRSRVHASPLNSYRAEGTSKKSADKTTRRKKYDDDEEESTDAPHSRIRAHSFGSTTKKPDDSNKYQINTHTRAVFASSDVDEGQIRKSKINKRGTYSYESDSDDSPNGVEISSQLIALQNYLAEQRRPKE